MGKFEGFYVRTTDTDNSVAVIFGRNKARGARSSFIQVITAEKTYNAVFDYADWAVTKKPFSVSIGGNRASVDGLVLDFAVDEVNIKAELSFGAFTPIKGDAMGFFRFFPFMECKHCVVSMAHSVSGRVSIDEKTIDFDGANGYIEGDRGKSFPRKYFWSQSDQPNVMVSAARIPYLGVRFVGTICIVRHEGREYRLATYRGARVKVFDEDRLVVKQGKKLLEVTVPDVELNRRDLFAPDRGKMNRIIRETVTTTVRYKFSIKGVVVFDVTSDVAAYEWSRV